MRFAALLASAVRLVAWANAAAWVFKAATSTRGLRRVPTLDPTRHSAAALAVVVPACNEETSIRACVESLLAQTHPNLHIVAVDDRSTDATGAILDALAAEHKASLASGPSRLSVLHVETLPAGWTGKAHALALGARHARALFHPEWLLFTDADVFFASPVLSASVATAARLQADHFVLLPTAILKSRGEAILMGFLQVMGLWATRLWRVADPAARDAVGIGAFNLLSTPAYDALGGFESVRFQILEDLTLARRVRSLGLRQRVAFGPGLVSVHWASGWRGVLGVMTKNLFAIFGLRLAPVLLASVGLLGLCLTPFAALLLPATRLPGVLALAGIALLYRASYQFSRIAPWTFIGFAPASAAFVFAILRSALTTLRQGGVVWRGTFYPLAELRRHVQRI